MRHRLLHYGPLVIALILAVFCACILFIYVSPMEDVSLDLSLIPQEDSLDYDPEQFDSKGWTVYTQEGEARTELTPNGFGGYTGLELGQPFYLSRVMSEALDSPTIQIGTVERQFSVWLDDTLIYTDCPELDNRIGHVTLPMSEWFREEPITITLPMNYQGKTLTIAQSFPDWTETGSVIAWPTTVRLYCGYAYESGLISETTRTTLAAALAFLMTMILLTVFVRNRNWSILCLGGVALLWMVQELMRTSFYYRYFDPDINRADTVVPLISTLALLGYLILRGGKHRKLLWLPVGVYTLAVIVNAISLTVTTAILPEFDAIFSGVDNIAVWLAFISMAALLVMGTLWWRKENRFYRLFIPLAYAGIAICWAVKFFVRQGLVWEQITMNLLTGQVLYLHSHTLPGVTIAAIIAAIWEAVQMEIDRRAEQQLMDQQQELTLASYENLRRQHEEVMILRHDMLRHYRTLHDMGGDEKRTAYLAELIGENQKIRPVVESGNEMLDVILNGKLGAAADAGIRVEIPHVHAPAALPLSAPDLCSLIMNIVDNAITAASGAAEPYLLLKIHERDGFLGIVCENSYTFQEPEPEAKKETVPKHGLGLKIVKGIVTKYSGAITEKNDGGLFIVKIVIPL